MKVGNILKCKFVRNDRRYDITLNKEYEIINIVYFGIEIIDDRNERLSFSYYDIPIYFYIQDELRLIKLNSL
jgi:hypothetical protein